MTKEPVNIRALAANVRAGKGFFPALGGWLRSKLEFLAEGSYITSREFFRDQAPIKAAALTYFTMLSLVPLLMILFVLFRTFGGEVLMEETLEPFIFQYLSPGSGEAVSAAVDQLLRQGKAGAIGSIGFIFLILTSFSLMDQMESNVNAIWGVKKRRGILRKFANYWVALSFFPLLVGASVSVSAYLGSIERVQELSERVVPQGYNLVPLLLQGLAFLLLFLLLPNVRVRFSAALAGAVFAALLWEAVKKGYLVYTAKAIDYNLIYGSLAALPLFLIWLFISWMVFLLGAEVSFVWQNYRVVTESRKRMSVPFQVVEALAVMILLEASRRFLDGSKPLKVELFAEVQALPKDLVDSTIDRIAAKGLVKVAGDEVILSRDPESLNLDEALEAVKSGGAEEPSFGWLGNIGHLRNFIATLEEAAQGSKREWSLKRLMDEVERWEH